MPLTKSDHQALSDAIESGDAGKVESLIQRHPGLVNHPDWTPPPLHCAVLWNQPDIAELLLNHGANLEMRDPDRQTTPLRYAIMYCKTALIPLLIARGAIAVPITKKGTSALQLAMAGANGAFEEYDDLPSRDEYRNVADVLRQCGVVA